MTFIKIIASCFVLNILTSKGFAQPITSNQQLNDLSHLAENLSLNQSRLKLVVAGNVVAYSGVMIGLYNSWYRDYPQGKFHFFNDNKEWLQVDKAGHFYSAYTEGRASLEMWKWTGMARNKRIWIGGLSGLAYQSIIEVLDGFSTEWGFSWGDYTANILGSSLLIGQEFAWNEQRIDLKFSGHRNSYNTVLLNQRADDIYGKSFQSRILKDYNAQTYWVSANLSSFLKTSNIPRWLNIAVGYGADGMFGAVENRWNDNNGNEHDLTNISRYRQLYLSPDIDFTRIKTKSKFLKAGFFILNSFKFPAPAIEFSNRQVKGHWLYF